MSDPLLKLNERLQRFAARDRLVGEDMREAISTAGRDSVSCAIRARRVLEHVVREIHDRRVGEPSGTRPLENILARIVKDGHFPEELAGFVGAVKGLANRVAHDTNRSYPVEYMIPALDQVLLVLEWYFEHERPAPGGQPESIEEDDGYRDHTILPFPGRDEVTTATTTQVGTDRGQIELVIDRDFASYTLSDQEKLLGAIREILGVTGNLRVVSLRRGSVRLRLELPVEFLDALRSAANEGKLAEYGVVGARPIAAPSLQFHSIDEGETNTESWGPMDQREESAKSNLIGRYHLRRQLGQGGFGKVYVGYDDRLDREVAIKFPLRRLEESEVATFLQEAKRLARLRHPGIVTVYDVGVQDGRCFIVSEIVTGTSLHDWLRDHRPTPEESARIVAAIADALDHAHGLGMIHRDVKPANVILDEVLRPVLLDFGLALNESELSGPTPVIVGTPAYMSPEQARAEGHRIDGRTDIYSLGVVLYLMLCGRRPFRSDQIHELLRQVREDEPQPPRQVVRSIPRELERICLKAMAKRIADRYTTAGDLAEELRDYLKAGEGSETAPELEAVAPAQLGPLSYPVSYSIALVLIFVLATLAILWVTLGR